jgi:hypothetical protein
MVKRGSPKKRKAAASNTTTTVTTASKKNKMWNSNKSKKKGNPANNILEMFHSIAEDPADPNTVVNMEGTQYMCVRASETTKRSSSLRKTP